MTEREHITALYVIVSALAERLDVLEQTRWERLKARVRTLLFNRGPIFN
jgi:hypothetical protein